MVNLCELGRYSVVYTYRNNSRGGGVYIFARCFEISEHDEFSVCNSTIVSSVSQIKMSHKF